MGKVVIGHISGFCRSDPKDKGKPVYQGKSSCQQCYPQCPKCPCYMGMFFCGCVKLNHECECHNKELNEERFLECEKCGPKKFKEALKWCTYDHRYREYLTGQIRRKLKGFKGSRVEKVRYIKELAAAYEKRYDRACMSRGEVDLLGSMSPYSGKVISGSMYRHYASHGIINKYPTYASFLEYAKNFDQHGWPLAVVPFE